MQGIINERKGLPFPLPCLRLLVPPLWLASAAIWQTVQKRVVMNYGMLEEFVTMVTEIVPDLLSRRQRAQLILGLRAQLILELCRSNSTADLQNIQSHLDRMQTLTPLWRTEASDADVGLFESNFLGLIQTLLKDPEEKQHFFQDVFPVKFGPGYDTAIQTLMWQFLSRLEKLLPQKNLQQVASLLSNVPSVLEECVESVSHSQQLKTLLQYHRDLGQLDGDDTPSDGGCIFSALCHPLVERVMITNKQSDQSQSETHTLSMNDYMDSFSNELEVEVATVTEHKEMEIGTSMDVKEEEGEREESSTEEECKKNNKRSLEKNGEEPEHSAEFGDTLEHVVNVEPMDGQTVVLDRSGFDAGNEEVACVGIRPRQGETEDGSKKVMVIGEDGMVILPEMMLDNKMMIDIKNPSVQLQRISTTNMLLPLASRPVRTNRGLKMKRFLLQERKATKIKPSKSGPKRPSPTHRISNQDNICDLCGKMFSRYADVIRHQRTHPGNCPYQCLKCKKRFQDSSGLREHQQTLCVGQQDKAPKQFKCTSCEWIFGSSSQIKSHMKSHSNERPYQCCNCESTFKHLSSMKAHEEACLFASQQRSEVPSGGSSSPPATGQNDPETSSSTLQKPSLEENDMESSNKVQLNSTPVDNGTEGPSHQCPLCRKSFLRPNDLLIHQQIICEAETSEPEKSQRLSHANTLGKVGQSQRAKESLTRRTCPVCSKILQRPALMEKHMRTHTNSEGHTDGVGPYHCLYCEKIYKYALNLKKHNEICRNNTPPSQSGPQASDESDQGPFCSIVQKQSLKEASDALLQTTAKDSDLSTSAPQGPSYLSVAKRPKHFRSCRVCGKNIVGYMKYHMRSHSEKRPHCCPHCGLKFKFDFGLRRHMRQFCKVRREDPVEESNAMKKRKMSKCDECGKEFGLKSTLKAHKLTHNPLYCAECRKVCPDLEMLTVHNLKHKPVQCTMCEKSFNVTRFLSKHYQDVHEFSGPFVCTHCHKSYSDLGAFIRHERTHTGDLPFQCSHCPKGFNWYQTLVTHERKHTGEKPYLCWECGKAFGSKGVLEKHMACRHIPQEKPLSCPQCEKTFWTKTSLNHHVDTHHKGVRYPCSYCGKLFFSPSALVRHDLIHTGERPFSCTYNDCDKTFKSNSELKIHMRYHTGERPFKCKVCGKGFVQAHYLTTHQRSHTKERPYACTLCDKAFTTGNQLKRHRMVHTGEKPYKCLECDKAFSRRHRLQDHQEKYQHTNCT